MTLEEFESNDEGRQWQYPKPVPLQTSKITKIKILTPLAEQHAWSWGISTETERIEKWKGEM